MTDYLIRTKSNLCGPIDMLPLVKAALAACHLYEGTDYDLIVAAETDPLTVDQDPAAPSSKQLYYVKKLHTEMSAKFAKEKSGMPDYDQLICANVLRYSGVELGEDNLTRRRVSDIIEALKSLDALL